MSTENVTPETRQPGDLVDITFPIDIILVTDSKGELYLASKNLHLFEGEPLDETHLTVNLMLPVMLRQKINAAKSAALIIEHESET